MTSYETICNRFLAKITDYELPDIPEDELTAMMFNWLQSAIVKCRKCASNLKERDDTAATFNVELDDTEIEILALLMVCEWLAPQLNSVLLSQQVFTESEFKWFAQSNHLEKLQTLRDNCSLEAKKLMRDYTYANNAYLK